MPWRDRHGGGRVGPRELRQPSVKCPLGTEAPPQGPGHNSPRSPPGLTCGAPPQASLAEASVGGFPPESEPVSSRARACPQPRRPTRGAAHPRAAPMARPLAALRDPSLLLPALLSAAARPLTSHSVLRATPPRAQRPRGRRDAQTPRRRAPRIHRPRSLPARLARSLLFLPLFALSKHYPGHVSQQQPTHSRHFLRRGCARRLLWQRRRAPWSWSLGTSLPGPGSQRTRDPQGPPTLRT